MKINQTGLWASGAQTHGDLWATCWGGGRLQIHPSSGHQPSACRYLRTSPLSEPAEPLLGRDTP